MSKKFKNFDDQLKKVINLRKIGKTREVIAEELDISVSKARKLIAQGELVSRNVPQLVLDTNDPIFRTQVLRKLKKPVTIQVLAETMHCSIEEIEYTLNDLKDHGYIIEQKGSSFSIGKAPKNISTKIVMDNHLYTNEMKFGVIADMHMCSMAERLDVLNAAYDEFERQGITTVLCPGNYVDGEARFNKHELNVHGLAGQCQYAIDNWPQKPGIVTYYVDGDDHEGWYHQNTGLEFGRYLMLEAQAQGRDDLVYMGYMEADIEIKAPKGSAIVRVMHAGGGSSYAISYAAQKLTESFQGGEKPSILIIGHYHKFDYCFSRNVHCLQPGAAQDQTKFMRKKRLASHVGFCVVKFQQDINGSVTKFCPEFFPFFDKKYYLNRDGAGDRIVKNNRTKK